VCSRDHLVVDKRNLLPQALLSNLELELEIIIGEGRVVVLIDFRLNTSLVGSRNVLCESGAHRGERSRQLHEELLLVL